jgi:hypothetical protein
MCEVPDLGFFSEEAEERHKKSSRDVPSTVPGRHRCIAGAPAQRLYEIVRLAEAAIMGRAGQVAVALANQKSILSQGQAPVYYTVVTQGRGASTLAAAHHDVVRSLGGPSEVQWNATQPRGVQAELSS